MTEEEFEKLLRETRVSDLVSSRGDLLRDLCEEIYFEGYKDGYQKAVDKLTITGPRIFGMHSEEYFGKNMEKIHRRVDAIVELNRSESKNDGSCQQRAEMDAGSGISEKALEMMDSAVSNLIRGIVSTPINQNDDEADEKTKER